MKSVKAIISSYYTAIILLIILVIVLAVATFVEDAIDTIAAQKYIYHSWWFELLFLLLILNYLGITVRYKMYTLKKWTSLIIHIAFIIIIIGATVTRYFGMEGTIYLRKGEVTSKFISSVPYLQVYLNNSKDSLYFEKKMFFSKALNNDFRLEFELEGENPVIINYQDLYLSADDESLGSIEESGNGNDIIVLDIDYSGKHREISLHHKVKYAASFTEINLDGIRLLIGYGGKEIDLPFSVCLDDFSINRYSGSRGPVSFTSLLTIVDQNDDAQTHHQISYNRVLDYEGYRFFQSTFYEDENTMVLSVNHDLAGTILSYAGYFLLIFGLLINLFNRNSRFQRVIKSIRELRIARGSKPVFITLFLLVFCSSLWARSDEASGAVSQEHADWFGRLMIQTYEGRIEPVHTYAYDIMHKISKKEKFFTREKGNLSAMQVFLDIMLDWNYWHDQRIIYIREQSVRDLIGIEGKYASLSDLFDEFYQYRLSSYSERSFRKDPADHNKFDREIIRLEENVNIYLSLINGGSLRIFPQIDPKQNDWICLLDTLAFIPLKGEGRILKNLLQLDKVTYASIMKQYLTKAREATRTNDYTDADLVVSSIAALQNHYAPKNMIPSETKKGLEIFYNKAGIFNTLKNVYGFLSIVIIIIALIDIFYIKQKKVLKYLIGLVIILIGLSFLYQTFGMILRWYLSGHAPWSNGYEALLLAAWASMFAGFSFIRYSRISLGATTVLTFLILLTAGHSNYDPRITELQPVLDSYWLIFHVATITISYGFFGLGFILGLIYMVIVIIINKRRYHPLHSAAEELTYVNELTLSIGLVFAVAGTFLGAVWANESWGRYWGWDAKETWSLIIILLYTVVLHLRLIRRIKSEFVFNLGAIIAFGSVIMTFIGVNYYFSKGLHTYATNETPIFPVYAWVIIVCIFLLVLIAAYKNKRRAELSET